MSKVNTNNSSNNQLVPVEHHAKVSNRAVALRKQLGQVASEFDWVAAPLSEIMDKSSDAFVTKICDGQLQVAEERKNCEELIGEWEVEKKKKEYQSHLIHLQSMGEKLSKKDVEDRLVLVERIVRAKHNKNASMDVGYFDDKITDEVNKFLEISNAAPYETPIDIPGIRIKNIQKRKLSADNEDSSQLAKELMEKLEQEKKLKKQKEAEKRKKLEEKLKQEQAEFERKQQEIEKQKESKHSLINLHIDFNRSFTVYLGERLERIEKIKEKEELRKKTLKENEERYKENLKKIDEPLYK